MTTKRLKIEDLQDLNIRELTEEETAFLQGGMIAYDPELGKPPKIKPLPCTKYRTKDGYLRWCAVIL